MTKVCVVDLEATCWATREEQGDQLREIIEIGACLLDFSNGEITNAVSIPVKPRFTKITPYCTKLTGWTPEKLDAEGLDISEALFAFASTFPSKNKVWASYGEFDRHMLHSSHKAGVLSQYGIRDEANPFALFRTHLNIKPLFGMRMSRGKEMGLAKAMALANLPFEGVPHSGKDDAYNTARLLRLIMK